ncbi:response regulator [Novosphingobium sp. EMRT-2]|nr:response regulator [Novosphingobium sp. EMRT-2]
MLVTQWDCIRFHRNAVSHRNGDAATTARGTDMRVLVVEDEPLLAMMLEESLADLGHEVIGPAASAEHALSLLTDNPVEAALLDFSLGSDGNSVPVARQLRDAGIPFCYLSGHATLDAGTGAPDAPLLSKPVSMAALEDALARMA